MNGGYIQPLGFILLRVITGVTLFWIVHSIAVKERIDRKDFPRLILCGLFGVAMNQMFFFSGLEYTTPINASLIMTTTPILVLVASAIMLSEAITSRKILGILLGAAGAILLIAWGQSVSFTHEGRLGDAFIGINACSYGIYLVLVKRLLRKYKPLTVIKWVFTFGLCFVLPFGFQQLQMVEWHTFSTTIWAAVLYVLLFTTFFAYLLNVFALQKLSPAIVSIYIYLQPLLATTIALLAGRDNLSFIKIVAGILIFTGVFFVSWKKVQSDKDKTGDK